MKFLIVLHNIGVMCGFVSIRTQYSLMNNTIVTYETNHKSS